MKGWTWFCIAASLAVCASACAEDIPAAPNLQPVLQAYANPTAVVDGAIMAAVADEIAEAAKEIEDSEIFLEILDLIIEVQTELDKATSMTCSGGTNDGGECAADEDCPGSTCASDLVLGGTCSGGTNDGGECAADGDCPGGTCGGGVIVPSPTGSIRVNYICPGWDERQFDPDYLKTCDVGANAGSACTGDADCPDGTCVETKADSANGEIDLWMTLDSGGIGRVVWGTAGNCLYLVPKQGDNCEAAGCSEASYDGGIALDLGDPEPFGQDIEELLVTFVLEGTIGFDDSSFRINQSFRLILAADSGLELLVDLADPALSETFNYIFGETQQLIRDATGFFGCNLEESRCFDESGTLFSW